MPPARPCLEKSRGGFLNQAEHNQILKTRNTKTSKLQPKNRQDRACGIELADWGFKFPLVKSSLPPALGIVILSIIFNMLWSVFFSFFSFLLCFFFFFFCWSSLNVSVGEMDVLWRRCGVSCRMYEHGKEAVRAVAPQHMPELER